MFEQIFAELIKLGDDNTKSKYLKDGCDTDLFGVKVGDLKKLVRMYKINNNNQLAIELIETRNFDAMYLGFLIMKPSEIDKQLFIKWSTYSDYYRIRIHSIAYGMAEHKNYQYFIDYFEKLTSDRDLSIYYAILAGRIIIDPTYNNQQLLAVARYIGKNINSPKYLEMPMTKVEMYSLIGYIGIQVETLSLEMIAIAETFQADFIVDSNRRIGNNINFIQDSIDRNTIGKKRKSARC